MQAALQVGLALGDELHLALELDRHLGLDLLHQIHLVKVDMQEIAVARAPLDLANQGFPHRLLPHLQIDELVPADLLERLDEVAAIYQDGQGVDIVPIDDGRKPTCPAKGAQVASTIRARLKFQGNGGGGSQRFSFAANSAAPILAQALAPAERAFTGTFPPFGRYFTGRMPLKMR